MPTDVVVAQKSDLEKGEMKQVSAGGTEVLLARTGERFFATHAFCSHYGAPLADGALSGDRVVCPWHHACFHLGDGHQIEPPGQDGLPAFDVRTEGDDVIVTLPDEVPDEVPPQMAARRSPAGGGERVAVVLGGGAAGAYAAEGLREGGFDGRVVMITADPFRPYDRINLSKSYLAGDIAQADEIVLRPAAFYASHDIEVLQGRTVERVEAQAQRLTFAGGETLDYDTLVLAPGGAPRRLDVDGADLEGVHTLRAVNDSDAIHEAARNARHAVVVGASFIGMECASSLRQLSEEVGTDLSVTVVAPDAVPFAPVLGETVGRMLRELHEENDVAFRLEEEVRALHGTGGAVREVELESGASLPADLVVVGIGVQPATAFVEGVEKADDRGLVVDAQLRAKLAGDATGSTEAAGTVYAAGDVAQFPYWLNGDRPTRIEHWRLACQQGRLAGKNAAGAGGGDPYRSVPFFWTAQHGANVRYVGHVEDFDEVVIDGDVSEREFIAYYVKDGRVQAAGGSGRDKALAAFEELLRRRALPAPDAIADADLVDLLRAAAE
jgi:NADPH-dependent 2,4-dienoyl-CoA reductase/sulfur reductase-like enzyme/nitrite reductase/ring-hydroxylating ferredoxin subunit